MPECLEDVGILCTGARLKICILEPFPAYGKVGVNQKIFKDQLNPRKWKKKIAESEKLWSGELGNIRYFYSLSLQKFGRRALKWFSSRKILFSNISKN